MADHDFSGVCALVVDDDASSRIVIEMMLQRLGIRVFVEQSGERVLKRALSLPQPPDIIFLDIKLPGQDGFQVLKQVRANDTLKHACVIATTAMDALRGIPMCKDAGFDGYIAKPLTYEQFKRQVASILNGQPIWEGILNQGLSAGDI